MGKKDIITKDYMSDSRIFADVFNNIMYRGERVIRPEKLRPLDATVLGVPYGTDGAGVPVQKFRDEWKYLNAMEDDSRIYLLLGIENQSEIHYAMPVKNMVYDALGYAGQVEQSARSYRRTKDKNNNRPGRGEYLTGFHKDDKLIPVVTLVVYFGADHWDAPRCLHEMLALEDKVILDMVPDYRINLFAPEEMSEEELEYFTTNLREVMRFIKYSGDKKKLQEIVYTDERFRQVDARSARVISEVTGAKFQFEEEEGMVNMYNVWDEIREDAKLEGHSQGVQEGRTQGELESRRNIAGRMLRDRRFSLEDVSRFSGLSVEELKQIGRR